MTKRRSPVSYMKNFSASRKPGLRIKFQEFLVQQVEEHETQSVLWDRLLSLSCDGNTYINLSDPPCSTSVTQYSYIAA